MIQGYAISNRNWSSSINLYLKKGILAVKRGVAKNINSAFISNLMHRDPLVCMHNVVISEMLYARFLIRRGDFETAKSVLKDVHSWNQKSKKALCIG